MKNIQIGDLGASCHITSNDLGLNICYTTEKTTHENKASGQNLGNTDMSWPVKYCTKVSVNNFLLTCKLFYSGKISCDHTTR